MSQNQTIIIEPTQKARAAIIWLHGLGADGHDFAPIVPLLNLPKQIGVRFIFPHAPIRPITFMDGYPTRAWYDITKLNSTTIKEDPKGIAETDAAIHQLIFEQNQLGINPEHVFLAGFSQGGAMALYCGLRYPEKLAGIMALSTYLPTEQTLANHLSSANRHTPIFLAHGTHDSLVPLQMNSLIQHFLRQHHYQFISKTYEMEHSVCDEELRDISEWLGQHIKK